MNDDFKIRNESVSGAGGGAGFGGSGGGKLSVQGSDARGHAGGVPAADELRVHGEFVLGDLGAAYVLLRGLARDGGQACVTIWGGGAGARGVAHPRHVLDLSNFYITDMASQWHREAHDIQTELMQNIQENREFYEKLISKERQREADPRLLEMWETGHAELADWKGAAASLAPPSRDEIREEKPEDEEDQPSPLKSKRQSQTSDVQDAITRARQAAKKAKEINRKNQPLIEDIHASTPQKQKRRNPLPQPLHSPPAPLPAREPASVPPPHVKPHASTPLPHKSPATHHHHAKTRSAHQASSSSDSGTMFLPVLRGRPQDSPAQQQQQHVFRTPHFPKSNKLDRSFGRNTMQGFTPRPVPHYLSESSKTSKYPEKSSTPFSDKRSKPQTSKLPDLSGRPTETSSLAAKSILMTRSPTYENVESSRQTLSLKESAVQLKVKHRHPYMKSGVMADLMSPYPESPPKSKTAGQSGFKKPRSESKKQILEFEGIVIRPVLTGQREENLVAPVESGQKKQQAPPPDAIESPPASSDSEEGQMPTFQDVVDEDRIPSEFSLNFEDRDSSEEEFEPQKCRIAMDQELGEDGVGLPSLRTRVSSQSKIMNRKPSLKEQYGIERPGYLHRNEFYVKPQLPAKNPRYINWRDKSKDSGINQYGKNIEQTVAGLLPPLGELDKEGVKVLKSIFLDRGATLFFQYPQFLPVYKSECRVEMLVPPRRSVQPPRICYKFQEGTSIYNCLLDTLHHAGLQSTVSSNWSVHFSTTVKGEHLQFLQSYQKLNHFPGTIQLGHKDLMWRNISRMKRGFGGQFDFCPTTYILPEDYQRFAVDRDNYPIWIMKPSAMSCGRGIKLIGKRTHVDRLNNYVISKYILYPHLINGYKYDLRLYVVVTGFDPLKVYLYREGLVRFATENYSVAPRSLKKRYMHLTNYSVNKNSLNFQEAQENDFSRSKWSFKMLRQKYHELGIDYYSVFARIKDLIIKTLISVEPHVVSSQHRHTSLASPCFELFGFDVLLDYQMKPWLVQVNNGPSLSGSSQLDRKIKTMLVTDMLNLAGLRAASSPPARKGGVGAKPKEGPKPVPVVSEANLLKMGERFQEVVLEYEEEYHRKGQFERIFPLVQNFWHYAEFFEATRPGGGNDLLWRYLESVQQSGGQTQKTLEGAFKKVSSVKV